MHFAGHRIFITIITAFISKRSAIICFIITGSVLGSTGSLKKYPWRSTLMNYGKLLWRKAYVGLLIILLCACLGSILGAWCGVLLCVDGCLSAAISKAV